jgi:hypothetical protein
MCHDVDDDAQIGSDGVVVGEVPGNDGEDRPAMETAQTARLVRMILLVRSRRRQVSESLPTQAQQPAGYCGSRRTGRVPRRQRVGRDGWRGGICRCGVDDVVGVETRHDGSGGRLNPI